MEKLESVQPCLRNLKNPKFGKLKPTQNQFIQDLLQPPIESYNWFLNKGIHLAAQDVYTEFKLPHGTKIKFYFKRIELIQPEVHDKTNKFAAKSKLYPSECRQRLLTYKAEAIGELGCQIEGIEQASIKHSLGFIPLMLKSDLCHLKGLSPSQLVKKGEEAQEAGGYFISKGLEKYIVMLIMQRRNYPICIQRSKWKTKGVFYSDLGVMIRCVKPNLTFVAANILHYLNNGFAVLSFVYEKQEYFIPFIIIIRALTPNYSDDKLYNEILKGGQNDVKVGEEKKNGGSDGGDDDDHSYLATCVRNMLRDAHKENLDSQQKCLGFIGSLFRNKLNLPDWYSDIEVAEHLIKKIILIHLTNPLDKANLLIFMLRKLLSFAEGSCCVESPDNMMFQEVLLPGHFMHMLFYEKLQDWLNSLKTNVLRYASKQDLTSLDEKFMNKVLSRMPDITNALQFFMATGNLSSRTGLGMMQVTGLVGMLERINYYRFMSHLRSVHRGSFFAQMRTTAVRKLYPESWGFLCPVHTPDGTPCGLLTHLTLFCKVAIDNNSANTTSVIKKLMSLGIKPFSYELKGSANKKTQVAVMVDGLMAGWVECSEAEEIVSQIRMCKVLSKDGVPYDTEVCYVPVRNVAAQFPGLFVFTSPARFTRPVMRLSDRMKEMIGSFEQVYMNIAMKEEEAYEGLTTHKELNNYMLMSELSSLTPFSNFNQSCRNMYQCQMAKQTMGVPLLSWRHRNDNKMYSLTTPQSPLVRPGLYDVLEADEYPLGTNACIAVMSYTGYDMEDAMIINRASYQRGLSHASIIKTEHVNLSTIVGDKDISGWEFGTDGKDESVKKNLDQYGLPIVGAWIEPEAPLYSYKQLSTGQCKIGRYGGKEKAIVDKVTFIEGSEKLSAFNVVLRVNRNPTIGDKYSSRHGQKGVCSMFYPPEDMPISLRGIQPDIIFNPHGFPSRMTIGMMIEVLAGKSAAEHGMAHNASPFLYNSQHDSIKYFGDCLEAAGFNRYGTEIMRSGTSGNLLTAYIFEGVVYYQRLRHMVLDKWQVRSVGLVNEITQQPLKGRKKGGGVRFGEMEKDALVAHGCSNMMQERMMHASDGTMMPICIKCGSLISPIRAPPQAEDMEQINWTWKCLSCSYNHADNELDGSTKNKIIDKLAENVSMSGQGIIGKVYAPYVLKYLNVLLASMGVKVTYEVENS